MKARIVYCVIVVASALLPASERAQSAAVPSPPRVIAPLLAAQLRAANAHDTDRFLASYVHDSTLVLVFNGHVIRGFAAVREQQLAWWQNGASDVAYSERAPADFTILDPTVVLVMQELTSKRTLPVGGATTGDFVATTVWQKRGDGWRVVEAHESTGR
jgi:ketosteroid isomerase-like protein